MGCTTMDKGQVDIAKKNIPVAGQGQSRGQHRAMAAQEQHKIDGGQGLPHQTGTRCRLCKAAPETVQHITGGCKMLAGKA